MRTYYDILEIAVDASAEEIKRSYRRLSLQYHPDRNRGDKYFEERFKEINAAYQVLKDPEERKRYDLNLYYASQPHHDTDQYRKARQAAYEYEQEQWMAEQIRQQVKANDRRFFKSVALAVCVMAVLLIITRMAKKTHDPYLPLILNEELAVKLKKYEDGGRKDTALLNEVISELRKRAADPALHAGLYAKDSCQVSGIILVNNLNFDRKVDDDTYVRETKPYFFLKLPKSIFVMEKDDPTYETSSLVSSIQILDSSIIANLQQHLNRSVTISCVLEKGNTDNDEYPAFTKDIFKIEVLD